MKNFKGRDVTVLLSMFKINDNMNLIKAQVLFMVLGNQMLNSKLILATQLSLSKLFIYLFIYF